MRQKMTPAVASKKRMARHLWSRALIPFLLLLRIAGQGDDSGQLEKCASDLLAADVNATDGYLSLTEYEAFVNERYYAQCETVVVAESTSQWTAFTALACFSCLEDFVFVDALPDCCLPFNNSRISIQNIQEDAAWLTRICAAADEAAVADDCYTAPPTPQPVTAVPPQHPLPNNNATTTFPTAVPISGDTSCDTELLAADVNATDGYLTATEFQIFLESLVDDNCAVVDDDTLVDSAFTTLACASCLSTSADLACCTGDAARISILDANITDRTVQQTVWLTRICTTAAATLMCNATTGNVTMAPITSVANASTAPSVANVSQAPAVTTTENSTTYPTRTMNGTKDDEPTTSPDIGVTPAPVAVPAPKDQPSPTNSAPTSNAARQRTLLLSLGMSLIAVCLV
jgi:hypothetical protein